MIDNIRLIFTYTWQPLMKGLWISICLKQVAGPRRLVGGDRWYTRAPIPILSEAAHANQRFPNARMNVKCRRGRVWRSPDLQPDFFNGRMSWKFRKSDGFDDGFRWWLGLKFFCVENAYLNVEVFFGWTYGRFRNEVFLRILDVLIV